MEQSISNGNLASIVHRSWTLQNTPTITSLEANIINDDENINNDEVMMATVIKSEDNILENEQ